jgi:hypothetical protein
MITPWAIEQLEAFDSQGAPVLSVYLDLDPGRQVMRSYRIAFEDLVKEARERLPEPTRADLAREIARPGVARGPWRGKPPREETTGPTTSSWAT